MLVAYPQMFVTTYNEEELFPAELHINQNPGGEDFGIVNWVGRDDNVHDKDIVCWASKPDHLLAVG